MTNSPSPLKTVIFSAPQGWGKSVRAKALLDEFGCSAVIEEWQPGDIVHPGMLHLTNAAPDQIAARLHCEVVSRGWTQEGACTPT